MESEFGPNGVPAFSADSSPWVWVLIPVGIVVAIGALAVCLHSKRRNRLASYLHSTAPSPPSGAQPPRSRSRAINERELEDAWVRGAPPTAQRTVPAPGGRWANNGTGTRWYWAGSEQRRAQTEEGLNELGEAPPPYEKAKKASPAPLNLNLNGEGPVPKSGPTSSASSIHQGFGIGTATSYNNQEEMEMHALAPAITGRTLTTIATGHSTASSVSEGARRSMGDPLSPFTLSSIPSTAASSIHERGLSPPPYDGVPPPAEGTVELPAAVPMELAGTVPPISATFPPSAWAESVAEGGDEGEGRGLEEDGESSAAASGSSNTSAPGSSNTSVGGVLTPPEPAVLR
ncbi:hypothetical protein QBC34DRAFT_463818 [Podospora aff. communis PSN243]|uniref:Proteophosphoglycan ppg4 n=1 Tax=Podospora aff. communis PSN243 TaxID=3040156 RepID=A0AAV9GME7_9PEZI|nr:hypothetical protein QBC34DRAFT_463818 [Podospora aff. communis PSN243]